MVRTELRTESPTHAMLDRCDRLVADQLARATDADRADIRRVAEAMIRKAETVGIIAG